ncbi:MAG: GDYXXLXY domain-containing protein [Bacteroidia bacterium]|nr:GDYXXLXY domain-containing protein [Bacteroidia bacterium]
MKKIIIPAFILMVAAQWLVPGKMIFDSEQTLKEGVEFKFKTQPIDPSDPFRGKYITLNFDANVWETDTTQEYYRDQTIYVSVSTDSTGFARLTGLYTERPSGQNIHLIKANVHYSSKYDGKQDIYIRYPFERFYVEESKASEAENLYRERQRDSTQIVYALVKVKNEQAILQDVMINGKSIVSIVRELNQYPK